MFDIDNLNKCPRIHMSPVTGDIRASLVGDRVVVERYDGNAWVMTDKGVSNGYRIKHIIIEEG